MATGLTKQQAISSLLKNLEKRRREEDPSYEPRKQVEGYMERLEGSGIDAEKRTDSRNLIERTLNLREDQNPLFDFLEVINRPQQALFGGIKSAQEGESFLKGAKEGISGNEYSRFKEILHNQGMEDSEKLGVDDVVGFVGDVFFDPMNFAMIPATAGASAITKAGKAMETADIMLKAANHNVKISKGAKAIKAAKDVQKVAVDNVKVAKEVVKATQKKRLISPLRYGMRGVKAGGKGALTGFDKMFEGTLTWIDKTNVDRVLNANVGSLRKQLDSGKITNEVFEKGVQSMQKNHDDLIEAGKHLKNTGVYREVKTVMSSTFNAFSKIPARITALSKDNTARKRIVQETNKIRIDGWNKEATKIAGELGINPDVFEVAINDFIEYGYLNYDVSVAEFLANPKMTQRVGMDKSMVDRLNQLIDDAFPRMKDDYILDIAETAGVKEQVVGNHMWYRKITEDGQEVFYPNHNLMEDLTKRVNHIRNQTGYIKEPNMRPLKAGEQEMIKAGEDFIKNKKKLFRGKKAYKVKSRGKVQIAKKDDEIKTAYEMLKKKNLKPTTKARVKERIAELKKEKTALRKRYGVDVTEETNKAIKEAQERLDTIQASRVIDKGISYEDIVKLADEKSSVQRFYSPQDHERFSKLGGATRGEDGIVKMKPFEELTPEQQKFRRVVDDTKKLMHDLLSSVDELGSDMQTLGSGYLPHIASPMRKSVLPEHERALTSWIETKKLSGNVAVMNDRSWKMSKLEANKIREFSIENMVNQGLLKGDAAEFWLDPEKGGIKLFEETLTKSFLDWSKQTTETVAASAQTRKVLDNLFVESALDSTFVKVLNKGEKAALGSTTVTKASLIEKLKRSQKYVGDKEAVKHLIKKVNDIDGSVLSIDNNIYTLIGRMERTNEISKFAKLTEELSNYFKRNKLLSPGFQIRNFTGNLSRTWMAGVPMKDIVKNFYKADKIMRRGEDLLKKKTLLGENWMSAMTKPEREMLQLYEEFMSLGFNELGRTLHDLPEHLWKGNVRDLKLLDKAAKLNGDLNWGTDRRFRMGMYIYGKQNPKFLQKYGFSQSQDAVRYALFDYSDLSYFEKEYMRKLIPFYTFTKKNLAYQFNNAFENPEKFNQLASGFDNLWLNNVDSIEDADFYKRENFWLPLPHVKKNGDFAVIKSSLPTGNLGEFAKAPLKSIVQSTAPYVRAPFELVANKQMFSGMPIQEFKGQKGFSIPQLGRKSEFALSQVGLDVPVKTFITDPLQGVQSALGDDTSRKSLEEGMLGWGFSYSNEEKARTRKAYDKLDQMREIMAYYKQDGVEILTLADIENQDRNKHIDSIISRLKQGYR